MKFEPAKQPTFYFVGVTTGKSSIMRVFPEWAKYLNLGDCVIRGIDCKWHDDPEVYREVVFSLKNDPLSLGGLVTTHKIDLLKASRDLFEDLDHYAQLLGEVSCISKQDGKLCGHAIDPITSGLSLEAFLPVDHWQNTEAEACLLGAGGSSLALTTYFMERVAAGQRPAKIQVTNRSLPRIEEMRRIHKQINPGIAVQYHHCPTPEDNNAIVDRLPGSLVVNATGLGKDAPGSPLTNDVEFPEQGLVWEFNYRGDLLFLRQAGVQKDKKRLRIEDGWVYFIHGWTQVMAEVFHTPIPGSGPVFDELSEIAARMR